MYTAAPDATITSDTSFSPSGFVGSGIAHRPRCGPRLATGLRDRRFVPATRARSHPKPGQPRAPAHCSCSDRRTTAMSGRPSLSRLSPPLWQARPPKAAAAAPPRRPELDGHRGIAELGPTDEHWYDVGHVVPRHGANGCTAVFPYARCGASLLLEDHGNSYTLVHNPTTGLIRRRTYARAHHSPQDTHPRPAMPAIAGSCSTRLRGGRALPEFCSRSTRGLRRPGGPYCSTGGGMKFLAPSMRLLVPLREVQGSWEGRHACGPFRQASRRRRPGACRRR